MEGITICYITSGHHLYNEVWDLRDKILRKPLGMVLEKENLIRDKTNTIFIAQHDGRIIGCVLMEPHGTEIQLRAMAVDDTWQGKGIGRMLVQAAEQYSWQQGFQKIVLHARKVVLGFYNSMGYARHGDEFIEVGIPHYMMEKPLTPKGEPKI